MVEKQFYPIVLFTLKWLKVSLWRNEGREEVDIKRVYYNDIGLEVKSGQWYNFNSQLFDY